MEFTYPVLTRVPGDVFRALCVCACGRVCVCMCARVYALKIVSMDKILRFTTCITIKSLIKTYSLFI